MNTDDVIAMRTAGEGLSRQGEYWSDKERKRLKELFDGGVGITEIALQLQRAETAVVQQLVTGKAFYNERPRRIRTAPPCQCRRCENQEMCPFSLKNRGQFCGIKESGNV